MPNLKGRQKDMSKLIEKLLNNKNSRLFNLIGWPGMGKSALVASMLDYIADRGLLKGGSIYFNARNISMCELFIRNFNQVLLSENPTLFGIAKERD
jgi:ABC-type dipeptide/oligopeptide/nickel transport system ATPase component